MAGLRKIWDALGLTDNDYEYEPYDDQPSPPPRPARVGPSPFQSPEDGVSNVRALPIVPADGGVTGVAVQPRNGLGATLSGVGGGVGSSSGVGTTSSSVRPIPAPASPKVHLVTPTGFQDAQEIGERFRGGQPVIMNLGGIDRDLKRRLVDFSAGLIYGLNGEMQRVGEAVFMLTPKNVEVSADERRKLQERGLLQP